MKTFKQIREALEIGTKEIVDAYKKATPGETKEAKVECPKCKGEGCDHCDGKGYHLVEAKFTDKQIKMAYGIINDPRYKGGNMTAIVKKIEQIAKGLSKHSGVVKAIKVTNEDLEEKYRPATQAEIDADKKKDRKASGKKRPSMSAKSISKKMYGNMRGKLKEDEVTEISRSMTPMRNKFSGRAVDGKKFDVYKKYMKKTGLDEPSVRMMVDNPNDAETKRFMKDPKWAKAVDLYKASFKEEVDERKLTPKEIKKALASAKAKAKPKSQVSLKKAPFKIPESLAEKLEVSDGMAKWIEDFQASDAPQFKGKDKNERREMAIAAYLAAKRRDKKED